MYKCFCLLFAISIKLASAQSYCINLEFRPTVYYDFKAQNENFTFINNDGRFRSYGSMNYLVGISQQKQNTYRELSIEFYERVATKFGNGIADSAYLINGTAIYYKTGKLIPFNKVIFTPFLGIKVSKNMENIYDLAIQKRQVFYNTGIDIGFNFLWKPFNLQSNSSDLKFMKNFMVKIGAFSNFDLTSFAIKNKKYHIPEYYSLGTSITLLYLLGSAKKNNATFY